MSIRSGNRPRIMVGSAGTSDGERSGLVSLLVVAPGHPFCEGGAMTGSPLLMLLRHGIAEVAGPGRSDEERRLTGEGKRKMREVAAGMRALELPVDAILTSPLRRAEETARIVAEVYDATDRLQVTPALAPGGGANAVFKALAACRSAAGVVLVGHEPDLSELASTLLVGTPSLVAMQFKKGGLAGIRVARLPPQAAGVLEFLFAPGHLRRAGQ